MRVSNHRFGGLALALVFVVPGVVACGADAAAPSVAPPTAAPTPMITPDPHLTEPATADQIFNAIQRGDLPLSVNNATAGLPNEPLVKKINAQVGNWPLIISEYRSAAVLRDALGWDPSGGPRQGDAPWTWVAMNIAVDFGPTTGRPTAADTVRQQQAKDIVALIDPLLWPIEQRSLTPVPTKGAEPAEPASPAPSAAAASATP